MQRKKFSGIFACVIFATLQEAMEENNLEKLVILADVAVAIETGAAHPSSNSLKIAIKKNKRFACNYLECDKTYSNLQNCTRHIRGHHPEIASKLMTCSKQNCKQVFLAIDEILAHYREVHPLEKSISWKKSLPKSPRRGPLRFHPYHAQK
jgi:hypothetical protein